MANDIKFSLFLWNFRVHFADQWAPTSTFQTSTCYTSTVFYFSGWSSEDSGFTKRSTDQRLYTSTKKLWAKRHRAFSAVHRPVLSHPPCGMASIPKGTMGVCWLYFGLSRVSFVGDAVHYERTQSIWHAAHSVLRGARCGLTHPVTGRFMQNAIHSIFIFW